MTTEIPEPPRPTVPFIPADQSWAAIPDGPRRRSRSGLWIGIGVGSALLVAAAVTATVLVMQQNAESARLMAFDTAAADCGIDPDDYDIMDGGESVGLDGAALSTGASTKEVHCFLAAIGAPELIETKIGQTRALDGRQEHRWDGFAASWGFHPTSGLSLVVEHVSS